EDGTFWEVNYKRDQARWYRDGADDALNNPGKAIPHGAQSPFSATAQMLQSFGAFAERNIPGGQYTGAAMLGKAAKPFVGETDSSRVTSYHPVDYATKLMGGVDRSNSSMGDSMMSNFMKARGTQNFVN
ncbi:hypothetical protein RZS08_24035, partial [Arthrospira platensis SPKY1]|nr:hypothetical protein [Arthrospira platensis SPKY1]